jgi:hypothetical protein
MINIFQKKLKEWTILCFGEQIANDKLERNHRFLEESLELVQSLGLTKEEANKLVDYVYNRPIGEPEQEIGGVYVTLNALCNANEFDLHICAETEINRIHQPEILEKIRIKQKTKPKNSPLPE